MRKVIVLMSAIAAGLLTAGFAQNGLWLPAIGCIGWNVFLLWVNSKPRIKTRSQNKRKKAIKQIPLYSYSSIRGGWRQDANERWMA